MLARLSLAPVFLLLLVLGSSAQSVSTSTSTESVGLVMTNVPEALWVHLPQLRPGQGILVDQVLPKSRAAQAGFKRHDILLYLGKSPLQNNEHFAHLLASQPNHKVPVTLLRRGQELTVLLHVPADIPVPKGTLKPGGPPAVTVEAKNLAGGKMSVTFTYFSDAQSKLERLTCSGSLPEIEKQVHAHGAQKRMPVPVQDLVDAALERLRRRQLQAPNQSATPAKNQ